MDKIMLERFALTTLEALSHIPAVPYYELNGASYIESICEGSNLQTRSDRNGNILVSRIGKDLDAPGTALVAHLDHPGFEAVKVGRGNVVGTMLGGLGQAACTPGVGVLFIRNDGRRIEGQIAEILSIERPVKVRFDADAEAIGEFPCAVVLDLPDFVQDGNFIRMRAVDDLAGCAASLASLFYTAEISSPGTAYGLFTRAEEDGLVGARMAAAESLLPEGTVVVSVESSHAVAGAEIGSGPVIRVGDRISTFDSSAEAYLQSAAKRLMERDSGFRFQRQLMDGGVCEGSAFAAEGYSVTGIAFPLGNYHNGLYQNVVEAEYIDRRDFFNGVQLLAEMLCYSGVQNLSTPGSRLRKPRPDQLKKLRSRN